MTRRRIAILISGRGSNSLSLMGAARAPDFPGEIALVLSNRPEAGGLAIAEAAGIEALAIDHTAFADRAGFDAALDAALTARDIDLICLAGFMRVLTNGFVERWSGRMINIHPSLLPKYPGLRTHERALAAADAEHGATVHQVVPEVDAGPAIAQARVPVLPGDDAAALAARVLAREHPLLVAVVRAFAEGKLTANASGVAWRGIPLHAPLSLDDQDELPEPS